MPLLAEKKKELEDIKTIRFVSGALLEVSADRIKTLRAEFEKNQLFYTEISELYSLIKLNALRRSEEESPQDTPTPKVVSVAMTSNSRFYGPLNRNIMDSFLEYASEEDRDCIVIGNTGKHIMETMEGHKKCQYLTFESDHPTSEEMRRFLSVVSVYDQVFVFHPTFVNIFFQDIAILDITHTPTADRKLEEEKIDYIFEPELSKMLRFFETRVRYLLFYRAMLESELARTAARLMAMRAAEERADVAIKKARLSIRKEQESFDAMRLLESLAGSAQWKKNQKHL